MTSRELVVLGTASQAPTRERAHNSCCLLWDRHAVLFDPGEGTQRQMAFAGVSATRITHIGITHFHGDHCLGLPGVIQRMSLDAVPHEVPVFYPASGQAFYERLRSASIFHDRAPVVARPIEDDGEVVAGPDFRIEARRLEHRVEAFGYRLDAPPARHMLVERLDEHGISGPAIGELERAGRITVGGRTVELEAMSEVRPGQSMALVMDTRWCDAALELADGVDLVVCESTFLETDRDLAEEYGHLTAAQAGRLAAQAGARRLVLTHFSQRYDDQDAFGVEATRYHDDVFVGRDLARVPLPVSKGRSA